MLTGNKEIDMLRGPLLSNIIRFAVPIMLSGVLQLLFNAADVIVVGRFAGKEALAAVGSTTSLINMLVNLFIGLSIGANILIAKEYGAKQDDEVSKTVHTAVVASIGGGILLAVIGIIFARKLLLLMGSPEDVIDLAVIYIRIYFMGMPAILFYNFGSSIMKAVGDADHPLYYLAFSGILNIGLNLIFVIVFHMSVAGVAIATIISQCLASVLIFRYLRKTDSSIHLEWKKLKLDFKIFRRMMGIGLPAGIQGSFFALANVIIQSAVNSFGSVVIAANSASLNIENFIYAVLNAYQQSAITFSSQNKGALQYRRTSRVLINCLFLVVVTGFLLSAIAIIFGRQIIGIFSTDVDVIEYGLLRTRMVITLYFLFGICDVLSGYLRGMGRALSPTVITLIGICIFRSIWIYGIFPRFHTLEFLYLSYPVSWVLTDTTLFVCMFITCRKYWRSKEEHPLNL